MKWGNAKQEQELQQYIGWLQKFEGPKSEHKPAGEGPAGAALVGEVAVVCSRRLHPLGRLPQHTLMAGGSVLQIASTGGSSSSTGVVGDFPRVVVQALVSASTPSGDDAQHYC